MDLVAFLCAFLGVTLAAHGYVLLGSTILAGPLIVLGISLSKPQKPPLLLPFSFGSWFVALPLGFLTSAVFRSPFFLGLALYYYGCITFGGTPRTIRSMGGGIGTWLANGNPGSASGSLLVGCKPVLHAEWDFVGCGAARSGETGRVTLGDLTKRSRQAALDGNVNLQQFGCTAC